MDEVYRKWLEAPNSHAAHEALHTTYGSRRWISGEVIDLGAEDRRAVDVSVRVGTSCYLRGSHDVLKALMAEAERRGVADRLNFRATFCLEACDHGPSVQVDGCERRGVALADIPAIIQEALARPRDHRIEPQPNPDGRR